MHLTGRHVDSGLAPDLIEQGFDDTLPSEVKAKHIHRIGCFQPDISRATGSAKRRCEICRNGFDRLAALAFPPDEHVTCIHSGLERSSHHGD